MGNFDFSSNMTWCRRSEIQGNVVPELSKFPLHEHFERVGVMFHVISSVSDAGESSQSCSGRINPRKGYYDRHCIQGRV
jgi:hypothetical protein